MNNEQLLESLLSDPEIIRLLTTLKDNNANDNGRYNKVEEEKTSYYGSQKPCHHDRCHHDKCCCNNDNNFDFIIIIVILFFFCGGFGFGGFFC